ncbi:ArnT family glycosyltransferase [Tepidiphilus olei]|uniref:ArnT family glycosyltransferase n=1 Tax=Tepidiphilus olei TaxID=2502184 RepID=UPI00115DA5C8|nr:glycosyltransferase family 39 protein [Tepidiphilus olei]
MDALLRRPFPLQTLPLHLGCWLVGISALTLAFLVSLPFLPIDETRYLGVAWEMFARGDFLVPHLNGEPYHHKPPLLFWIFHLGWALFGINDWWPRVAGAAISFAGLLLTARLARRLWPEEAMLAPLAGTILLGAGLWAAYTPAVMFDMLLAVCVLLAMNGLWDAAQGHGRAWTWVAAGIGLGVLAKGPVVLLHVLPAALLWPWWRPLAQPLGRWYRRLALAVLGGAAIALAWAVPAAIRGGPEYAHMIFWGQSAGRIVKSFAHRRPWWWYFPLLPLLLYPWLLWPSAWRALSRLEWRTDSAQRFLLAWAVIPFVAFCAISGKQAHYLLPLFPAVSLLLARTLATRGILATRFDHFPLLLPLLAATALLFLRLRPPAHLPPFIAESAWWPIPALAAVAIFGWLAPGRILSARVSSLAGTTVLSLVILALGLGRAAAPYYDVRPTSRFIAQAQAEGRPVGFVGKYYDQFHFYGRLTQPIEEISWSSLHAWAKDHPHGVIIETFANTPPSEFAAPAFQQPYRGRILLVVAASDVMSVSGDESTHPSNDEADDASE